MANCSQNIISLVARLLHLPVCSHKLFIRVFADKLHIALVLILEVHHVGLVHWQFSIGGEALALAASGHVASRITALVAHMELPCGTLLAQPLACVRVRCGLPSL